MSLATKIAHNMIAQTAGRVFATALGVLAVAMMTRYLGQAGFGQFTVITTFVSFFAIAADFGLTLVTSQMLARADADEEKIVGNLLALRLISAAVFLGLAPIAILAMPYPLEIKIGVAIAVFSFLFAALNQIFVGFFQKNLKMGRAAGAEALGKIFLVAAVFLAIKYDLGLFGILTASVAGAGVNFFINYAFSRRLVKIKPRYDKEIWLQAFSIAWPLATTIILNLVYLKTDTIFLSFFKSEEEVGLYGAAYRVLDILITIPYIFAGLIMPIMAVAWAENNLEKLKNICQKSFDAVSILVWPMIFGAQLFAVSAMTIIAGREFTLSGNILKILIFAGAAIFLGIVAAHGLVAVGKQKEMIKFYAFVSITAVLGYLFFIPKYSFYGAAAITIYSEVLIALAGAAVFWKNTGFFPKLKNSAKALLSAILSFLPCSLAIILTKPNAGIELFVLLPIFLIIYLLFLQTLKGLDFIPFLNKNSYVEK